MCIVILWHSCVGIHLFTCVNIHLLVCVTIHNEVYFTVYFVLKRELKERVWRIEHHHKLKFGSWEPLGVSEASNIFTRFFSYNKGFREQNPRVKGGQLCKLCSDSIRTWHTVDVGS